MRKNSIEENKPMTKEEQELIVQVTGMLAAWSDMHGYDPDSITAMVAAWLMTMSDYATFKSYRPTIASYIRAKDTEELACMIWNVLEERAYRIRRARELPFPQYRIDIGPATITADSLESLEDALNEEMARLDE